MSWNLGRARKHLALVAQTEKLNPVGAGRLAKRGRQWVFLHLAARRNPRDLAVCIGDRVGKVKPYCCRFLRLSLFSVTFCSCCVCRPPCSGRQVRITSSST